MKIIIKNTSLLSIVLVKIKVLIIRRKCKTFHLIRETNLHNIKTKLKKL